MRTGAAAPNATLWLLIGDRPGEIAQQRTLAAATGLPSREIQVAKLRPVGGQPVLDLAALRPPWPRIALSFGKTLPAAMHLRAASGGYTRIVHLGRARGVPVSRLDLLIPMPQDRLGDAGNVVKIRMPFNVPARSDGDTLPQHTRLLAAGLPRPWITLIIGGPTRHQHFVTAAVAEVVREACRRATERGGSVLVSTSPRTPAASLDALRRAHDAPGEFHVYSRGDAGNPFHAYLQLADELVVTGDSGSMLAECWRSGKPVWVAPLPDTPAYRIRKNVRRLLPVTVIENGWVAAVTDINEWLAELVADGYIGRFGQSDPRRPYRLDDDTDLPRVVARIKALLD